VFSKVRVVDPFQWTAAGLDDARRTPPASYISEGAVRPGFIVVPAPGRGHGACVFKR